MRRLSLVLSVSALLGGLPTVTFAAMPVVAQTSLSQPMSEQFPSFPGGQTALYNFLAQNLHYPTDAYYNGIEGTVIVKFIVEKDGSITNVYILKSVDPQLDNEAIRVIESMPKWTPGCVNGQPARMHYNLPITFKIPENNRKILPARGDQVEDEVMATAFTEIKIVDDQEVYDKKVIEVKEIGDDDLDDNTRQIGVIDCDRKDAKVVAPKEVVSVVPKDKNSTQDPTLVFSIAQVEQKPFFVGGEAAMYKWIQDNMVYPADAQEEGASGRVIVQFIIEKDGSISSPKVVRGKHPSLDREALRLVKMMPKWTPGHNNRQAVRVRYLLPINFKP